MRPTVSILFAAAAFCASSLTALAAEPAGGGAPQVPHMSREEALAYLKEGNLALVPSNLVSPILNGKVELVEALLAAGVDANDKTDMPQPLLQLAASSCAGDGVENQKVLAMIEVLLAHGAKVNVPPGASELSPLMVAAQQCPPAVVRRLVRAGADLTFRTSLGISPLSMALIVGNYDAAEALIDAGARLSAAAASKLLTGKKDDARLVALVKRARAK